MEDIRDLSLERITESRWINLNRVKYKQNGHFTTKDVIHSHDSSSVLVHNLDRDVFVFVRQFRPAVYMQQTTWPGDVSDACKLSFAARDDLKKGFTLELCAGILEGEGAEKTAVNEVLEEVGYSIQECHLHYITATRNNSEHSGTLGHLFYARVRDSMRVREGGGNEDEGELLQVVEVPVSEALAGLFDDALQKPVGFTFALLWFCTSQREGTLPSDCPALPHQPPSSPRLVGVEEDGMVANAAPMEGVEVVSVEEVKASEEFDVYRLHYKQNSIAKAWDFIKAKHSCSILVHNTSRKVFMLVKRFKPAIYCCIHAMHRPPSAGNMPPAEVAEVLQLLGGEVEEEEEEEVAVRCLRTQLGYVVDKERFEKIINCRTHIGITGVQLRLLYVEVSEDMKQNPPHHPPYTIVEVPVDGELANDDDKNGDGLNWLKMAMKPTYPLSLSLSLLWYNHFKRKQ